MNVVVYSKLICFWFWTSNGDLNVMDSKLLITYEHSWLASVSESIAVFVRPVLRFGGLCRGTVFRLWRVKNIMPPSVSLQQIRHCHPQLILPQCLSADYSQRTCDNFGNYLRRLAFSLTSTFLYERDLCKSMYTAVNVMQVIMTSEFIQVKKHLKRLDINSLDGRGR